MPSPAPEPVQADTPWCDLELSLDPAAGRAVFRALSPARPGKRPPRPTLLAIVWHDSPDGMLDQDGLALEERQEGRARYWRLARIRPAPDGPWLPGQPAATLAEAPVPDALPQPLPQPRAAVAWLDATRRTTTAGTVAANLLEGEVRGPAGSFRIARLTLSGPADAVCAVAQSLAQDHPLSIPPAVLAAEALARPPADAARRPIRLPRRLGPPLLPADPTIGDAFVHVLTHLTDVMLHYAPQVAPGEALEPVHQMRVAMRRLRSALGLFERAVACAPVAEARRALRPLAAMLGPARDWDVFLAGTGRQVGEAFAAEPAVARLLAAAVRRRAAAYAELRDYLDSTAFHQLGLALACLATARPWERQPPPDPADTARRDKALSRGLASYAAHALRRRARPLLAAGPDLSGLPAGALHELRLHAKRLRYACEIFAPLFPGHHARRTIRRLSALQELLGHLNDGTVADALMAELGALGRGHAGGIVRGYVAGRAAETQADMHQIWHKLRRMEPFWD